MKNLLKLFLLITILCACNVAVFSQTAFVTYSANTNLYKYSGLPGQTMSKSDVLQMYKLEVEGYTVKSFKVSYEIGYNTVERVSTSYLFTNQQQNDIFNKTRNNSKIYIENIVVAGADGMQRKINPLVIRVAAVSKGEFVERTFFTYTDSTGIVQEYQMEEEGVSKSVLLNAVELCCDAGENIQSFSLTAKLGAYIIEIPSSSNKFTDEMRNFFMKGVSGTKFYFENIKDGAGKPLPSILLRIK